MEMAMTGQLNDHSQQSQSACRHYHSEHLIIKNQDDSSCSVFRTCDDAECSQYCSFIYR